MILHFKGLLQKRGLHFSGFAAAVAIVLVFKYHQMRENMLQKATYAKDGFFVDGLASKQFIIPPKFQASAGVRHVEIFRSQSLLRHGHVT